MYRKELVNKIREDVNLFIFNFISGDLEVLKLSNLIFNLIGECVNG